MDNKDELKNNIKNRTCYYFDDIIRIRDINPNNILLNEKLQRKILIYDVSYKTFMGEKPCVFSLIKQIDLLKCLMELDIQYYLIMGDMTKFVISYQIFYT